MKPSLIPAVSVPTEGDFRGHPVLTLPNPDDATQAGIQFGIKKCRAFVMHVEAVRAFVAKHYQPKPGTADGAALAKAKELLKVSGMSAEEIDKQLGL